VSVVRVVRVLVMAVRPPVAVVLLLFAALGQTVAGAADQLHPLLTTTAAIIAAWFVNATALNDLGDEAIDRVNLVGALGRPLVSGHATRRQLAMVAVAAGAVALALAASTGGLDTVAVVAAGLLLNAAYSLRPLRLCERGAVAVAVLPVGYVAVPYLVGALAVAPVGWSTLAVLPGLSIAFVGRIVLKDVRDVEGDARFG